MVETMAITADQSHRAVPSWRHVIGLIATFSICMIAAGHGVGPIGLLLVLGWPAWAAPGVAGWLGIVALVIGRARGGDSGVRLLCAGVVLVALSWGTFRNAIDVARRDSRILLLYFAATALLSCGQAAKSLRAG